jgi:TatD DNase family protein
MLIDSHVNLHAPQFADDRQAVIDRAREAGIGLMVNISDKVSTFDVTYAVAETNADIWATVGTHPHEAKENPHLKAADLMRLADRPRVVGIGECGLDFHYDLSPRDVQADVFRSTSSPRAKRACRWWCTPARPTTSWRRSSKRNTPSGRSAC